jgi:hypothetical protein
MIQRLDSDFVMTDFLDDGQNWTDTPDEMTYISLDEQG